MSPFAAAWHGLRTVLGSPRLVLGLWAVGLLVALPLAWTVGRSIERSIGPSLAHEGLRQGFDMSWFGEYSAEARGIERSFDPTLTGAGALLDNLEGWLTGRLFEEHAAILGAGLLYALLWSFLLGGVIDGFVRPSEGVVRARFAQACGIYFFRFLRLALISAVAYWLIYRLHRQMFELLESATRDVTREWTVMLASLGVYAITALLLTLVHVCFGYAKIATVVENRRGMLLAVLRGARFVLAFPGKTFGLYYGLAAVSLALIALWTLLAPGAGQSGAFSVLLAFLVGQVVLAARLVLRLSLLAGQTALFKAHAPRPVLA